MEKKVLIYGARILGKIVQSILSYTSESIEGFISDIDKGEEIIGNFDFVSDNYSPENFDIAIAIGYSDLRNRWKIYENVKRKGYNFKNVIHPDSYICNTAILSEGVIIMPRSIIDFKSRLKELSVIWPGVNINHESSIGENTFVSPGAIICGNVDIGNNCFVGAGSIITEKLAIPDWTFIKAGKTITKNKLNNEKYCTGII
jgi:sugar O-acyltransferase (sialic acid O-acetyltransferase NeuD family)